MAQRVATAAVSRLSARVIVVNRTKDKAARLATSAGGEWKPLDAFRADPPRLDALVTAATCEEPLLSVDSVRLLTRRSGGRLAIMDLACPANVDPSAASLQGVRLLTLDDLRSHASRNLSERREEAREAERLVARAVRRAWHSISERALDLGTLRGLHEELADEEVRAALAEDFSHLSPEDRDALVELGRKIARRHAHLHLSSLRDRLQAEGT
jgi:glutamyl-tRNA reductase